MQISLSKSRENDLMHNKLYHSQNAKRHKQSICSIQTLHGGIKVAMKVDRHCNEVLTFPLDICEETLLNPSSSSKSAKVR